MLEPTDEKKINWTKLVSVLSTRYSVLRYLFANPADGILRQKKHPWATTTSQMIPMAQHPWIKSILNNQYTLGSQTQTIF